ncbi:hypothetical protein [Galbibacter sp.]|jgi:hypothetical protein|uniref:hypothetical protein n=1 Tax=Galbibacter sp. TaxID=2918471 RepID=UPI003A90FBC1
MKKYIVISVLLILPIAVYLFFSSGVNNFGRLPVLSPQVAELVNLEDHNGNQVQFKDQITVLTFLGSEIGSHKLNAFNLNQKIYKRFNGFKDFHMIVLLPETARKQVDTIRNELGSFTDIANWHFVYGSEDTIKEVFNSLNSPYTLDETLYTPYAFIIDKAAALRGRKKDKDTEEPLYGYDATSVAVLHHKMVDDVKVMLAEYRLALRKNGNGSSRESYLKMPNKKDSK